MLVKYVKRFGGGLIPNTPVRIRNAVVLEMFSMDRIYKNI
jgi:hypothetical protein